jgi:small subunit ribosomal protein S6
MAETATRFYEAVIIVHPDATLEQQKELFKKNKATIESFKGSVFSLDTWGKRSLATPIGKTRKALFFHTLFQASGNVVAELERTMRINDRVLRFTHTRLDERTPLVKHYEAFKNGLAETANREREREAKAQLRKAAMAAARAERGGDRAEA